MDTEKTILNNQLTSLSSDENNSVHGIQAQVNTEQNKFVFVNILKICAILSALPAIFYLQFYFITLPIVIGAVVSFKTFKVQSTMNYFANTLLFVSGMFVLLATSTLFYFEKFSGHEYAALSAFPVLMVIFMAIPLSVSALLLFTLDFDKRRRILKIQKPFEHDGASKKTQGAKLSLGVVVMSIITILSSLISLYDQMLTITYFLSVDRLSFYMLLEISMIIINIIIIVPAVGILFLKKWALYFLTITLALKLATLVTYWGFSAFTLILAPIPLIIVIYLWSIKNDFINATSRQQLV